MHRCSTLPEALGWIADFSNYMYCCKNKRLSFGLQELHEFFGERYKGVPFDEIVRNINVFLKQDAYGSFSYEHENYRDLFVAEHIRNSLVQSFDRGRTAAELFADNLYSDAVLLMLADMTDCAELLDNLRRNSFSGDWYSDSCAKATAVVYKTCILNKQQPPVYDLNLTKTHIRYLHHCDFSGCLVSDATFIKNNIETAVFSVLYDENRKTIYAAGKHSLHVFDEHLQPKETIAFAPENHRSYIACSAQNSKAVVFINACGEVFCFDKDKKDIKKLNADIGQKAYSVVSMGYNGAFIIGTAGGMFIFEKETLKYIALPENKPVFPLEKLGASIVYCTQNKVMLYANGSTRELWTLDNLCVKDKAVLCGQTIIKTLVLKSRNYILNFNRPGVSVVAEVKFDSNFSVVAEPVFLTEAEETIPKERLQKSLHIDYYKINDMAYTQGTLLCACNSGFIRAISRNENGWKLDADKHFDLSSISNNPGECVESICMCGNRVVFGSTTRGLYLAENINDWRIIQYQGGQNNGIHKIIFSKDQNTLYAFLYNHGFIVLKRKNNKEPFRFADKISTVKSEKQEWCWAGTAVGDSSLYIASGSRLLCYAGNCLTEVHDFGEKIENLTAGTNVFRKKDTDVIFALYGHNISKIKITDGKIESKEEIKFEGMKSRRTLSAAVNPFDRQLYCGFSDISEYTEYGINRCATVGCMPQNAKDNYMKSVIANHYGGWYRSIDFIVLKTGFLCICSGLQNNNNHVAVVYDSNFKEICTLEGHSSYVMDARFLNYDPLNNSVSAATCGADGKINLYTFTLGESTVIHPLKTSPGEKDRLFNIIPDGKDLLVSSLDGNIYRWKNCCSSNDELQIEFSNNDIWITDSNFADIDCTSVFSLKKALESLNNIF